MWDLPAPPFALFVLALCFFHCSEFLLALTFDRTNLGWHCELISHCCTHHSLRRRRRRTVTLALPLPMPLQPGFSAGPTALPCWRPA